MFSVLGTQYVFCCRYSMCFLLKVLNVFSVEGTQCVFCFRYYELNAVNMCPYLIYQIEKR